MSKYKHTFSSCVIVKEIEENLVVRGGKEGDREGLASKPGISGMKRDQQDPGDRGMHVKFRC